MNSVELEQNKIDDYFAFIRERHNIWIKKQRNKPYPWTNDPILSVYKFTNVYRELDKVTIFFRTHLREPYANDSELFFNIAISRRYNVPEVFDDLGYITDYDVDKYVKLMQLRKANHQQIFTGAYMTCGTIRRSDGTIPNKIEQIFDIGFRKLWNVRKLIEPQRGDTLESAFNRLMDAKIPGFGTFVWYEVISDLRWTRYLQYASDINSWANTGPGALRGIKRIAGDDHLNIRVSHDAALNAMRYLLEVSEKYLSVLPSIPSFEMRDVEHSLCEFDKYERVRLGQGRPRCKYHYEGI